MPSKNKYREYMKEYRGQPAEFERVNNKLDKIEMKVEDLANYLKSIEHQPVRTTQVHMIETPKMKPKIERELEPEEIKQIIKIVDKEAKQQLKPVAISAKSRKALDMLGFSRTAVPSQDEIRNLYRKLAREHFQHIAKKPEDIMALKNFEKVTKAYEDLTKN